MLRLTSKKLLGLGFAEAQSPAFASALRLPRFYHERVVDHFDKNDPTVGTGLVGTPAIGDVMKLHIKINKETGKITDHFDKNDPTVGTGLVGAPAIGDVMKLHIKINKETGKITDACFKTFGCVATIGPPSVVTVWVKGKQMEEVLTIKNTEIANNLSPPPVKLHCSMFVEDAIKAAVKDYKSKRAKSGAHIESTTPAEKVANA